MTGLERIKEKVRTG